MVARDGWLLAQASAPSEMGYAAYRMGGREKYGSGRLATGAAAMQDITGGEELQWVIVRADGDF